MVMVRAGKRKYDYPSKVMETVLIDKTIKTDFREFCRHNKIKKSKLVEEFMRTVILRFKTESANQAVGYVTIDVMRFKRN
jgi:hypothetical protein